MAAAMGHILPPLRGLPPLSLLPHGVLRPAEREPEDLKMSAADLHNRSALLLLRPAKQLRNAKGDPERSPLNPQRPYRSFLPLLLALHYPLAMRIATDHILGKSESKVGV